MREFPNPQRKGFSIDTDMEVNGDGAHPPPPPAILSDSQSSYEKEFFSLEITPFDISSPDNRRLQTASPDVGKSEFNLTRGNGTAGHNAARKVIDADGTEYYRKVTVVSDKHNSVNTQAEEKYLHDVQKALMPEAIQSDYLKYNTVDDGQFQLEIRPGTRNLTEFMKSDASSAHKGYMPGLATLLLVREMLLDGDNKLDNILIIPDEKNKFFAIAIDGEKVGDNLGSLDINDIDSPEKLISTIKGGIHVDDKRRLTQWIDPDEIKVFVDRVHDQKAYLTDITTEAFKSHDGAGDIFQEGISYTAGLSANATLTAPRLVEAQLENGRYVAMTPSIISADKLSELSPPAADIANGQQALLPIVAQFSDQSPSIISRMDPEDVKILEGMRKGLSELIQNEKNMGGSADPVNGKSSNGMVK